MLLYCVTVMTSWLFIEKPGRARSCELVGGACCKAEGRSLPPGVLTAQRVGLQCAREPLKVNPDKQRCRKDAVFTLYRSRLTSRHD